MFTGIVRGIATVARVHDTYGLRALYVRFPERAMEGVERGASVSVAGTCLTVVEAEDDTVRFDWSEIESTASHAGPNQAMAKLLVAARAEGANSRWPL